MLCAGRSPNVPPEYAINNKDGSMFYDCNHGINTEADLVVAVFFSVAYSIGIFLHMASGLTQPGVEGWVGVEIIGVL